MGFEWRLVPVEGVRAPAKAEARPAATVSPAPRVIDPDGFVTFAGTQITSELLAFIESRVTAAYKFALPRAGIVSIDQAAAMSDEELLMLKGVGHGMVKDLRTWIRERGGYDGLTLAREVYELLRDGVPRLDEDDSLQPVLAEALPALANALGVTEVEA